MGCVCCKPSASNPHLDANGVVLLGTAQEGTSRAVAAWEFNTGPDLVPLESPSQRNRRLESISAKRAWDLAPRTAEAHFDRSLQRLRQQLGPGPGCGVGECRQAATTDAEDAPEASPIVPWEP